MLEKIPDFKVYKDCEVKVTMMGNITEKLFLSRRNKEARVQRLPGNKMLILSSGEVKDIKPMETRMDSKNSLKKSMRALRNLLNANIVDVTKCRWVTLTYAENMTDTKRLYEDFKRFNMKLRYHYGKYEYIVAMEPQGRGAWHAHVVLLFDHTAPFIPNDVLRDIWGHGFVTIKKLDDVDNVGAYLTAYLGDMEITEATENGIPIVGQDVKTVEYMDDQGEKKEKYYIKGARLNMYPPNFNLYRSSRGIKKPIEEYCTEEEARKKVSAGTLTFQSCYLYTNPIDGFQCVIDKKYYNNKRSNPQEAKIEFENLASEEEEKYIKPTFLDEMRHAHTCKEWHRNYDVKTGEVFSTPFDE